MVIFLKRKLKSLMCLLQIYIVMMLCIQSGTYAVDPLSQMNNLVNNYPRDCEVLVSAEDGKTLYTYHAKNLSQGVIL